LRLNVASFCNDFRAILTTVPGGDYVSRLIAAILLSSVLVLTGAPTASVAQTLIIRIAPPELPVYEQPEIPAYGYIWAPGYWAYGPDGYFWVPGTWVQPPSVGLLWTPGYWGWHDGVYGWNAGYWGPHVGFYGGVDYGFGYGGVGYEGGRWNNGVFAYNQTVNNFGSVSITNVYSETVVTNTSATRVSFNGGTGGTTAQPTPQEQAAAREPHVAATSMQTEHEHTASTNKALLASVNHGNPAVAATSKPGELTGKGIVPAKAVQPSAIPPKAVQPSAIPPKAVQPNARLPKTTPSTAALEKNRPTGGGPATNPGQHPALNNQAKPLAAVSPPKASPPKPAPPHPVTASRPAKPPVKPSGPPPKKKPE
jgi:WXXGXW repeat (2 copies)